MNERPEIGLGQGLNQTFPSQVLQIIKTLCYNSQTAHLLPKLSIIFYPISALKINILILFLS